MSKGKVIFISWLRAYTFSLHVFTCDLQKTCSGRAAFSIVFSMAGAVDDKEEVISKLQLICACFRDAADPKTREPSVPVSTSTGPDPDRPSAASGTALVPLARAEEDEMMEDVAEMAGGGQVSGQDALANLETTLRPVEKYAVRFLEEVSTAQIPSAAVHSGAFLCLHAMFFAVPVAAAAAASFLDCRRIATTW